MATRPDEALRPLARSVIAPGATSPFGAYCFGPDEPGAGLARSVEGEVFLDRFGNTPDEMADEYGAYDSASLYFVILDHGRGSPAGSMRLIANPPGGAGLKSWNDLDRFWGADSAALVESSRRGRAAELTWDIASLAVSHEYQNPFGAGLVSLGLYQSVVRTCLALGIENLVAVLDSVVYRMTRARYAEPFVAFAEPRPYLGSRRSYPVYCTLSEWEERLLVTEPHLHGIIYEGVGLTEALAPLDLALLPRALSSSPVLRRWAPAGALGEAGAVVPLARRGALQRRRRPGAVRALH